MFHLLNDNELNILKRNEVILEKPIKDCLRNKETFNGDFSRKNQDSEKIRLVQLENVKKTLIQICELIVSKIQYVKNIDHQTEQAQEVIKSDMVDLKSLILEQKKLFKNQILILEQKSGDVETELSYFHEKLPTWKEQSKSLVNFSLPARKVLKPRRKFQEIDDFFDFVHASGGKEGGWRKEDHDLFIKFLMKYSKIEVVARSLNEMLPDISTEEVYNHFDWFIRYQNLLRAKKEVIIKWKEEKLQIKSSTDSTKTNAPSTIPTECGSQRISKNDLKERLKLWRAAKEENIKRQNELERQKIREKKEKEEKRKQKQEEMRKVVDHWKSIKLSLKEAEEKEKENLHIKESQTRSRTAKKLIKQFQSMDELRIQKIREVKLKKEQATKRTKSGPLERLTTLRDPQRLLKPTQQWMNRVQNSSEEYCVEQPIPRSVLKMPKLHIPEWRKTIK